MGLRDRLRQLRPGSPSRGKCSIELRGRAMKPAQVTEQSLQVWRALPAEIRHDPSMASFKIENERITGSVTSPTDDDESIVPNDNESTLSDEKSFAGSDFVSLKKPKYINEDKSTDDDDGGTTHSDHDATINGHAKTHARRTQHKHKSQEQRQREKHLKRFGLMIFWLFAAIVLMTFGEKHLLEKTLEVPQGTGKFFKLLNKPTGDFFLKVVGAFNETANVVGARGNEVGDGEGSWLMIQPQISHFNNDNNTKVFKNVLQAWRLPLAATDFIDLTPAIACNHTYKVTPEFLSLLKRDDTEFRLHIFANASDADLALTLTYNPLIVDRRLGSIMAALILLIFYALLVWEVFERPFVAMISSILSVAVLACFNDRPNMDEIIQWMDMELLTLLFCMMILVLILTETGVFDYIAVFCFEISGGKIWPMIYSLCFITCLVSSFLDNMTTLLLMTPVAIRLCEVMSVDPVNVIMGIIVHANIGGALTPIGDPISIIIGTNHFIAANGVTFMTFVEHTLLGVILSSAWSCIYLRFVFRDINTLRLNETKEIKELRREIKVWQRASNAISSLSKDADVVRGTLNKRVKGLKRCLRHQQCGMGSTNIYETTLEELKEKYPIKNKKLLLQAAAALTFTIICFFIQSVPQLRTLPLGWVALLGVIVLLIILDRDDMEHLMHRIEWSTLLFFAAMFVMMECVERLGLFAWIGEITEHIILFVDKKNRLAMAIFIILWMSALASAVLESIPVTAMMVKLVVSLVSKESLGLPLQPLVWALAFGPSLGGNGTLYGASSNVIAAGIAEQHGYKISFTRYLRTVFPMMLGQLLLITIYLMCSHIVFEWH